MEQLPKRWPLLNQIIEQSLNHPLGAFRLKRLFLVLKSEIYQNSPSESPVERGMVGTKLRELADTEMWLQGDKPTLLPLRELMGESAAGAYLGDHGPNDLLYEIQQKIPSLLKPEQVAQNQRAAREVIQPILEKYVEKGPLSPPAIGEALMAFKDPISQGVLKDLLMERFYLETHVEGDYQKRLLEITDAKFTNTGKKSRPPILDSEAHFFGNGDYRSFQNRPILVLKIPSLKNYSPEPAIDAFLWTLGKLVHEHTHFLALRQGQDLTKESVLLKEETQAHARQFLWLAEKGRTRYLETFHQSGFGGFGLFFRDTFEKNYWPDTRGKEK